MTDNPKDAERLIAKRWIESRPNGYSLSASDLVAYAASRIASRDATIAGLKRQVERLTIKTPREQAMRETIEGQGLSMVAMGKELREKDAKLADLERRLAEARAELKQAQEIVHLVYTREKTLVDHERERCWKIVLDEAKHWPATDEVQDPFLNVYRRIREDAPPPPVAEASGEPTRHKYPNAEQAAHMAYFYEHHGPQSTADHTERARDDAHERSKEVAALVMRNYRDNYPTISSNREPDLGLHAFIVQFTYTALTAAERTVTEKMRALDAAAQAVDAAYVEFSEHGCHDARLITALYARLDDLHGALSTRDAALTEGADTKKPPADNRGG